MSWARSVGSAIQSATQSTVRVISSIPPKAVSTVPSIKPSVPSIKPPAPPKAGVGTGTLVGGVGIAGLGLTAGLMPTVFSNDGVVSQAIQAGAQVGTTAVIADQVGEFASQLTSNPTSMLIVGAIVVGGIVLYMRF